jgi:hypothetical protein
MEIVMLYYSFSMKHFVDNYMNNERCVMMFLTKTVFTHYKIQGSHISKSIVVRDSFIQMHGEGKIFKDESC